MRKYQEELVTLIDSKSWTETKDGIEITMRPVPDDARPHVFDQRIIDIIETKKALFGSRASEGFKLSNERYRPDKVTYDLTTSSILSDEHLVSINGTHKINVYTYRPGGVDSKLPVIVYLHGGGMTAGDIRLYANQMKLIAQNGEALVVFPEYRLAPESPYPGPIDDAFGTLTWVVENADSLNIDLERLMVVGDSAGGSLTNACVLRDTKNWIKKVFEIYPAVDFGDYTKQDKYVWSFDAYPVIDEHQEYMEARVNRIRKSIGQNEKDNLYLQGKTTYTNPEVSVVFASDEALSKFPPTVIVAAEYDFLRVSSDYFVKKLDSLGVPVKSIRYLGCDHGFFDMLGTVVQSESLCNDIVNEIPSK